MITGRSELVEDALGDAREDARHGIDARLGILVEELHHLDAVARELAAQEAIRQEYLADDVHQVEQLAQEEAQRPAVVLVQVAHQVGGQDVLLALAVRRALAQRKHVHALDDAAHLPVPIPTRRVSTSF